MKKEIKVLITLRDFGKKPSSSICAIAGINYQAFQEVSENLLKKKQIKKIKETLATYWEITKKGEEELIKDESS